MKYLAAIFFFVSFHFYINAQDSIIDQRIKEIKSYFSSQKADTIPLLIQNFLNDHPDYNSEIKAYTTLGQLYNRRNKLDSAIYYGNLILKTLKENDSLKERRLALAYNILAIANTHRGLYTEAASWHYKGIEAAEKVTYWELYYTHTHGLANVYRVQKEYTKALENFRKCVEQDHYDAPKIRYASLINMGLIYAHQGNLRASNSNYQKALKLCEGELAHKCQIIVLINTGANLERQRNYLEAFDSYQKAYRIASQYKYPINEINALLGMGAMQQHLQKHDIAISYFSKAMVLAKEHAYFKQEQTIYDLLIKTYTEQRNYAKAFDIQQLKIKLSDSLEDIQKHKEIESLEIQYQTLQKEKKIIELEKDQEAKAAELDKQRVLKYSILIAFFAFLIPLSILLIIYYQKLRAQNLLHEKQKEVNSQKINALIKDQELQLMKASIVGQDKERKRIAQELHDTIGGNLASIKLQLQSNSELPISKYQQLCNQIDDTYQSVRDLSHNLIPKKFNSSKFTLLINSYIKNIASASNLSIHFNVLSEKDINALEQRLHYDIFMILQELIANTIKHAEASSIEIHLNAINKELILLYEDNGKGFAASKKGLGIGLSNIQDRIIELKGSLELNSELHQGFVCSIIIPLSS